MPIALDGESVLVVLKTDDHKPEESRPAILCRYMSCRQTLEFERTIKQARDEKDQAKSNELLDKALLLTVTGAKNIPGATVDAILNDSLTPMEKWELAYRIPPALMLSESDKKKSSSASPSPAENSAASASAGAPSTVPA